MSVAGFENKSYISDPGPGDVLVIWNRSFHGAEDADRFARGGASVLVAENGLMGKGWLGGNWYSLALSHVAVAGGVWPHGGKGRWDSFGVDLSPWHPVGGETVVLGQRGIGERGIKSPEAWAERTAQLYGGRVRSHPGKRNEGPPLVEDLVKASAVITWASSSALQALAMGVSVYHDHPNWVGAAAALSLREYGGAPAQNDEARLAVFHKVAWAMWRIDEIDNGSAFEHLFKEQ